MKKEVELWKVCLLMFVLFAALIFLAECCADKVEVHAAVVTGSESLGGMSKLIDDYCDAGGDMNEVYSYLLEQRYRITDDDMAILERIVEAEATDGTIEQKMNVTSCILARVESEEFPNTVEMVVFQPGQFAPIRDKRYFKVKITDSTKEAVKYVLDNGKLHSYLYFCADCESYRSGWFSTLREFKFDGMHHYFTGEKK